MSGRSLINPRNLSLAAVCFQSTALAIVLHVSQAHLRPGQPQYKASSAVLITELGKLLLSFLLALRDTIKERRLLRQPVHVLPSPELYAHGEEVHAKDLYRDDPYDPPSEPIHYGHLQNVRSSLINNLRRRSSQLLSSKTSSAPKSASMHLEVSLEGPGGSSHRFPELTTFQWQRPALSPIISEKHNSPEIDRGEELMLWKRRNSTVPSLLWTDIFGSDWYKMAIPAVLFAVQNNLIYVAARNLSVPVFQITFQLKTLITALAAVIMLGRRLALTQWLSLIILGLGVATMQLGAIYAKAGDSHDHASVLSSESTNYLMGVSSILISCVCSAVAATYFELVIKRRPNNGAPPAYSLVVNEEEVPQKPASLWVRNIQLSLFSTVFGLFVVMVQANPGMFGGMAGLSIELSNAVNPSEHWYDPVVRSATGFFVGFHPMAWLVILLQTVGGLLIAVAIKHADNVAKGFALSVSIVFTFLLSVILFDFKLTAPSVLGGLAVVGSTLLFEMDDSSIRRSFTKYDDAYPTKRPLIRRWHYTLFTAMGVTFLVAVFPSRHYSVTTAAWEMVASQMEHIAPAHTPTIAIADMAAVNKLIIRAASTEEGQCGWGVGPKRWSTKSAYGSPHPVPDDYPFYVTNTDQYALDDILSTRLMDYSATVPLLSSTAPDFIFLPILSQLYSNPWGCNVRDLSEGIRQTTEYIRQIVASVGPTEYPRIIIPVATIRSNLEKELFKPELMDEIKDSVVVVSIEGAPKSYKEGMKYMIDVPYPTSFHLAENWETQAPSRKPSLAAFRKPRVKTDVGDYFLEKERPYLLHYAAAATHPWGLPASDPFNGFALRNQLHKIFTDFVAVPPANSLTQILFDDITNAIDGNQNLTAFHEHMADSVFCPMPAGDSPTRRAMYEAMLMGCIPVIFRERSYGRLFPSSPEINDMSKYTVYIDENEIINGVGEPLISRLESIPPTQVRRMQLHLQSIARKLQWSMNGADKELYFQTSGHSGHTVSIGDQPRYNHTESLAKKAQRNHGIDAFDMLMKELQVIKSGTWIPGLAKDTRRGMNAQHFGSWRNAKSE